MKLSKYLKSVLFVLFFVVSAQQVNAQTYKFVAKSFSVLEKNNRGKWGEWSDLQNTSLVITLDTSKNRIIVYSQEIQLYEILEYGDQIESETDLIFPFTCTDDDGQPFSISIITRKNQGNRKQMYINHPKAIVVYNIENLPDSLNKKE